MSVGSDGGVLSIAKLRVGQEAYQLSGVAESLGDYYTGRGEADGQWMGAGAVRLGLEGAVSGDDLRAVLAGLAPGSGGLSPNGETIRPHPRRVPGFDLTFKAPKSVSTLYAVSDDPRVQGAIIEAGEAALRDTLGWLEREAIHVRRGTGNERFLDGLASRDPQAAAQARIRTLQGRGLVAAVFRHRTSRAGDPLLHWHTLVANMVEGPDGRWSAFVHPDLYRVVRTAGEVFQTVLREELTARLGVQWRPGRHVAEVAGVPQLLCDVFSKRSHEIEAWLEATGTLNNREGRQQAVLATRRAKPEVESERFDAAWKAEALAAGWGPDAAEQLLATLTPGRLDDVDARWRLPEHSLGPDGIRYAVDQVTDADGWVRDLLAGLTVEDSTFTRADVVRAVASQLGDGATIATIERVVARVFASPDTIPIDSRQPGGARWTSAELLTVERRFLDAVDPARQTRLPVASEVVDMVIGGRAVLGDDQAAAVRAVTGSAGAVAVLVGPAGTGKTFTLDTVRAVYEAAGYRVVGAAPSARAALELNTGAGIGASTLQRLAGEWSRGYNRPDPDTVLVVDEAAMAGIRDLETLVTATVDAGGRVVLAGDHRQLPEVTAGGGFAAAANRDGVTVAELSVNRRQQQPWEQAALVELRDGHVATAVAAYRAHGRVVIADDHPAMLAAAVEHWFTAHAGGLSPVLLAGTNDTVDALNHTVRTQLGARGLTGGVASTFAGREFLVGERVVFRRNSYHEHTTAGIEMAVFNGQTGTVTAGTDRTLVVRLDLDGSDVVLPAGYLESGGVDYGYALTSHRAQGGTWDLAIGVGVDGLYREAGYLQLSRGRVENWLVLTAADVDLLDRDLDRHDSTLTPTDDVEVDVDEALLRRLNLSRAKLLASTHDPHASDIAALAAGVDLDDLQAWARHASHIETVATGAVGINPATAAVVLARLEHTAAHVAAGQTVTASDRHNIGTVAALDDTTGRVTVEFVAANGRTAQRELPWSQIQILDPNPPRRDLTPTAIDSFADAVAPIRRQIDAWNTHLAGAGVEPDDAHVYHAAARLRVDRAAARLAADEPVWLTQLIGPRPSGAMSAQVWDDTVREIATHQQHNPNLAHSGIGGDPDLARHVAACRVWLATYTDTPSVPVTRTRTLSELHTRRRELDTIFDTAPADYTLLISQLRDGGQLSFDDTTQLLTDALAAQDDRSRWILAHWPHIVEYAETTRTLDGPAGVDTRPTLDTLAHSSDPTIAAVAATPERWFNTLAAALTTTGRDTSPDVVALIGDVAHYCRLWSVIGTDPLGLPATSPEQAAERCDLQVAIEHAALDAVGRVDGPPSTLFDPDLHDWALTTGPEM